MYPVNQDVLEIINNEKENNFDNEKCALFKKQCEISKTKLKDNFMI